MRATSERGAAAEAVATEEEAEVGRCNAGAGIEFVVAGCAEEAEAGLIKAEADAGLALVAAAEGAEAEEGRESADGADEPVSAN